MNRPKFWIRAVVFVACGVLINNIPASCAHAQSASFGKGVEGAAIDVQLNQHYDQTNIVLFGRVLKFDSLAILPQAGLGSHVGYGGAFGLKMWYDRAVHLRLEAENLAGVSSHPGRGYARFDALRGDGAYFLGNLVFRSGLSAEVRDSTGARAQLLLGPTLTLEFPEHVFFGNHIRLWHGFGLRKGSRGSSWLDVSLFFP